MVQKSLFLVFGVVLCLGAVSFAQFPEICIENIVTDRVCCPNGCGGVTRGVCEEVHYVTEDTSSRLGDLDRASWPVNFFYKACRCKFNFWGYDCSECKPGWKGENCEEAYTIVRKNIKTLSDDELEQYKDAMNLARTASSDYMVMKELRGQMTPSNIRDSFVQLSIFDTIAWQHYFVARKNVATICDTDVELPPQYKMDGAHSGPAFPPWHRAYLLILERELQKLSQNESFALPYWNWAGEGEECSICNNRYLGESREDNGYVVGGDFSKFKVICKNYEVYHNNGQLCNPGETDDLVRFPGEEGISKFKQIPPQYNVQMTVNELKYDNFPKNTYPADDGTWFTSNCTFRGMLEGSAASSIDYPGVEQGNGGAGGEMHNIVHDFLAGADRLEEIHGAMGYLETAASDPIFFMHHNNIDRIFESWIQSHAVNKDNFTALYPLYGVPVNQHINSNLVPFFPLITTAEVFKQSSALGYTYDHLEERTNEISRACRPTTTTPPPPSTTTTTAAPPSTTTTTAAPPSTTTMPTTTPTSATEEETEDSESLMALLKSLGLFKRDDIGDDQ